MHSSIGLITLNARFIHSSLSLRYLRNAARNAGYANTWIREFIINQPLWKIAAEVLRANPDILGVSIYIWNRQKSLELIELLQKQKPDLQVVVGGPEVSFDETPPTGCTLIAGEGEAKWVEYLNIAAQGALPSQETLDRWKTFGTDLPKLIAPYLEEDLPDLQNRYAYLETSRGCPYLCSFCLSALDEKVRYFDEDVVRDQITMLIDAGIKKFKFVDRTFNLNPKRMKRLIGWLSQFTDREFHFEVVGDKLHARRVVEGGWQRVVSELPVMVTVANSYHPLEFKSLRGARMVQELMRNEALRSQYITTVDLDVVGADPDLTGLKGSPTIVAKTDKVGSIGGNCAMHQGQAVEALVREVTLQTNLLEFAS